MTAIDGNLIRARAEVRKAKNKLGAVDREYDGDRSVGLGKLELIAEVLEAERQLENARAGQRRIDPTSTE